jgi:DNA-binding MarR family transcriptional regulator
MSAERVKGGRDVAATADRVHSGAIRLLRRLRRADAASGLSGPQASALSVLVYGGPTTAGRLAAAEQVTPASISRVVKELEAADLIRRTADPDDARAFTLTVTEKGRAMFDHARDLRLGRLARAMARLPEADLAVLDQAAGLMLDLARAAELGDD